MVNSDQAQSSSSSNGGEASNNANGPPCLIVLGMAGAGKTSFVQVMNFINILIKF
jgi:ABC-type arginine transport system ATPase subunit